MTNGSLAACGILGIQVFFCVARQVCSVARGLFFATTVNFIFNAFKYDQYAENLYCFEYPLRILKDGVAIDTN